MHNRPPVPVIIVVVIALAIAGYFLFTQSQTPPDRTLTASGTIESVTISIAPELAGRVVEISVAEGDLVRRGDVLMRLDDTLLAAQRAVSASALETAWTAVGTATAAVDSARVQYDLAYRAALAEEQSLRTGDWKLPRPGEFDQPTWYFTRAEQLTAAQAAAAAAGEMLAQATDDLARIEQKASSQDFLAAEETLLEARAAFYVARDVLERTNGASDGAELREAAQTLYDDAEADLDDAQAEYDDALTTDGAADVLTARAELRIAQERVDTARDRVRALETGMLSPRLQAAQAAVVQAEAALAQSQAAVAQAEAALALVEAQITKLTVTAPADGVVLTRSIEPGEVVNPGSIVLVIGRTDSLTLTVYVPEDRLGEVALGQLTDVSVDSFPGETFAASVMRISETAEFTPRNVQTVEGRKTTVFAVELRLEDPGGRLRAGMPADVVFK